MKRYYYLLLTLLTSPVFIMQATQQEFIVSFSAFLKTAEEIIHNKRAEHMGSMQTQINNQNIERSFNTAQHLINRARGALHKIVQTGYNYQNGLEARTVLDQFKTMFIKPPFSFNEQEIANLQAQTRGVLYIDLEIGS